MSQWGASNAGTVLRQPQRSAAPIASAATSALRRSRCPYTPMVVWIDSCPRLETFCSRQVFDGQRSLAAVLPPQHPVGVSGVILLGVDACRSLRRYVLCYVILDATSKSASDLRVLVELRGLEVLVPAKMPSELHRRFQLLTGKHAKRRANTETCSRRQRLPR